jgi:hypothetical protein
MEPVCSSAFSSAQCFSLYALLIVLVGSIPALFGSVAVGALSSRLEGRRILVRIGAVWLIAVGSTVAITAYLSYTNFYDGGHGDIRAIGTTVGFIFAIVTAFVVAVVRRDALRAAPPGEPSSEELRSRNPASA